MTFPQPHREYLRQVAAALTADSRDSIGASCSCYAGDSEEDWTTYEMDIWPDLSASEDRLACFNVAGFLQQDRLYEQVRNLECQTASGCLFMSWTPPRKIFTGVVLARLWSVAPSPGSEAAYRYLRSQRTGESRSAACYAACMGERDIDLLLRLLNVDGSEVKSLSRSLRLVVVITALGDLAAGGREPFVSRDRAVSLQDYIESW